MLQKDGIAIHMGVMINCPSDLNDVTRSGNYDEFPGSDNIIFKSFSSIICADDSVSKSPVITLIVSITCLSALRNGSV